MGLTFSSPPGSSASSLIRAGSWASWSR